MNDVYMTIENDVKREKIAYKKSNKLIDRLMFKLIATFSKLCIRHTTKFLWFDQSIKKSISHTNVDISIKFSTQYLSFFEHLNKIVRKQLQTNLITSDKTKKENKINKTRLLFFVRLFRMISNLSFFVKFWKTSQNAHIQFTNKKMKKWIKNEKMIETCSLFFFINKILNTNFKLTYLKIIFDAWNENKNDKLLILSEFVLIIYFVAKIYLFSTFFHVIRRNNSNKMNYDEIFN